MGHDVYAYTLVALLKDVIIMTQTSPLPTKDPAKSWILLGIAVISIIGSLMHFVYDWSGKAIIVGIIAPTNESIWEHLKHSKAGQHWLYIAIVMLILLITAFTACTFKPPHIPLFMDSTSGKYGI